jgi:hypothetical protein
LLKPPLSSAQSLRARSSKTSAPVTQARRTIAIGSMWWGMGRLACLRSRRMWATWLGPETYLLIVPDSLARQIDLQLGWLMRGARIGKDPPR